MRRAVSRRQAGFTYLWVLMSVAFMGLGWMVAADVYATSLRRQQEAELLAIGRQFRRALNSYHNVPGPQGVNQYPEHLEDLLEDRRGPVPRKHLRKIFVDPMTGKATWGEVRVGGRIVGVHSLSSARPLKKVGFDETFKGFEPADKLSAWIF
jgi:type II secretory pathway pseudopilin PulG